MTYAPHQQRVIDEKTELDGKHAKLQEFIKDSQIFKGLPEEERGRLIRQSGIMWDYSNVLGDRIAAFTA